MYCTMELRLQCDGCRRDQAVARFQAVVDDLRDMLTSKHGGAVTLEAPLELDADNVEEHPDCDADFE